MLKNGLTERNEYKSRVYMYIYAFAAILFFAALKFICVAYVGHEPDYYWNIKLGEWIVENGQMMKADAFSWLTPEYRLEEFAHSWAGSVIVYLFSLIGSTDYSYLGGYILMLVVFVLICGFILYVNRKDITKVAANPLISILIILLPSIGFVISPRAMLFGYLLFAVTVWIFGRFSEDEGSKSIYLLPIVSFLWANLHGGMAAMPIIFVAVYFVAGLIGDCEIGTIVFKKHTVKQRKNLILAGFTSFLASLINPYGIELYTYASSVGSQGCREYVGEWQAASLSNAPFVFVGILFVICIVVFSNKKTRLTELLAVGMAGGLSLIYVRGVTYFMIALMFFICKNVHISKINEPNKGTSWLALVITGIALSLMGIHATSVAVSASLSRNIDFTLSDSCVSCLKSLAPKRLYNNYNSGGYLIYEGIATFIDSRGDLFPTDVLKDGMLLESLKQEDDTDMIINEKYKFDVMLVKEDSPLDRYLSKCSYAECIYRDSLDSSLEREQYAIFKIEQK